MDVGFNVDGEVVVLEVDIKKHRVPGDGIVLQVLGVERLVQPVQKPSRKKTKDSASDAGSSCESAQDSDFEGMAAVIKRQLSQVKKVKALMLVPKQTSTICPRWKTKTAIT